jgi:hypothetical protein
MAQRHSHAGEQHPDEWRQDLSPDANAGQNYGAAGQQPEQEARNAYDIKELHEALDGFSGDELKQIIVLGEGSRLQQGGTYVDLATPDRREFKALGSMVAGRGNYFVPKDQVDYQVWNKLIGVSNPERLGEADDSSAQ